MKYAIYHCITYRVFAVISEGSFWAWEDFKTMKRIRLGDALVDKGLITQEQLQEALTKGKTLR